MIVLRNLTKTYSLYGQRRTVADRMNAVFPPKVAVALMGRNGAGKSTLLRMIAGTINPTSGEILSTGSISFPVGFSGSFHPDLTGAQNTRFVARIYGVDTEAMAAYVEEFAELGSQFYLPLRSYSSGMRSRLSFGVSMGLNFDTYLIDEVTAVGDAGFKKKSSQVFKERMKNAGALFVSHSLGAVRDMCQAGAVLENGQLTYYDDVEEAIERHIFNMDGPHAVLAGGRSDPTALDPETGETINFPADARMVFGIGGLHSGADWLSIYLRRHRACYFSLNRPVHYFDILAGHSKDVLQRRQKTLRVLVEKLPGESGDKAANSLRGLRETAELLAMYVPVSGSPPHKGYLDFVLKGRKAQPMICDFTPTYAQLDRDSMVQMASIGAARFLFLLRDPAERLWAQICAAHPAGPEVPRLQVCLRDARKLIGSGRAATLPDADYRATIERLESVTSAGRIKYVFYEDLFTQGAVNAICGFLGIPPRPIDELPDDTGHPALPDDLRAELRQALAAQYDYAEARFGSDLPASWRWDGR